MAVAYRSGAQTNFSSSTTLTLTEPAGAAENDILIAAVYHEAGAGVTITPTASWNLIHRIDQASGGPITCSVYWFRRAGTAPSYVFTMSSSTIVAGGVVAYSGAITTGDPQDVTASTNSSTGSVTITCNTITTSTANSMIIGVASSFDFVAMSSASFANERLDADADKATVFYDDGLLVTPGATGNKTITRSSGTTAWTGSLIALKPPAVGGSTPSISTMLMMGV